MGYRCDVYFHDTSEADQCPPEDSDVDIDDGEEVYDYDSTPVSKKLDRRKKVIVPRGHKKLVAESVIVLTDEVHV